MLALKQSHVEAFIRDPVMAAWAIFGVELDTFQKGRFREMWFVPFLSDDSGISLGKTELSWLWCQLRAILLPNPPGYPRRIVGVYYPTLESARSNFEPKYEKYIDQSEVFRRELRPTHGGKLGFQNLTGAVQWAYRNGSLVQCPAPNFASDANTQASKRFNDLLVDEAKEIDAKSKGLDRQLLGRASARCFNPKHPVWANHIILLGHAEAPTHPYHKRIRDIKRAIHDGDQDVAMITSSFRDWSPEFETFLEKKNLRRLRIQLTPAEFGQQAEGLWLHGGKDFYSAKEMKACRTVRVRPELRRDPRADRGTARVFYGLGNDTALGESSRSDLNAWVAWKAEEVPESLALRSGGGYLFEGERWWRVSPVYARQLRNRDGSQLRGILHRLHRSFGFRRIVLDPGGGGAWVCKELWKPEQLIDGSMVKVVGLCRECDATLYPEARPIVSRFQRKEAGVTHVWEEQWLASDDGIIEATHRELSRAFENRAIAWPAGVEERREAGGPDALPGPEEMEVLRSLEVAYDQIASIKVKLDKDGEVAVNSNGFRSFRASGKKDLAYAAIYGFVAILSVLRDADAFEDDAAAESEMAIA